jgi:hypothetical protein
MKTVTILTDFSSYPNGKDERAFKADEETDLSNEHADLLIAKGLAKETKGATKAAPTPAAASDKKDDNA